MNRYLILCLAMLIPLTAAGQKPPLDHSVYDGWKSISASDISEDGKWITYEISPQQGDGWLYIVNSLTLGKDSVFCGSGARISPDSKYIVYQVKPEFAVTRQAKKKKLKEDQMPKNKLYIRLTEGGQPAEITKFKSFDIPRKGSYWMAYLLDKKTDDKKDVKLQPDSVKPADRKTVSARKPPEPKGTELVILNPVTGKEYRHQDVVEYIVARDGRSISFVQNHTDTSKIDNYIVSAFDTRKESVTKLFEGKGDLKKLSADRSGERISFIYTTDTSKVKIYDLWFSVSFSSAVKVVDSNNPSMPSGWSVSDNGSITFSEDGTRIYFGTSVKPVREPEDTLLAEEKYRVDIWSWDDDILQPMQKIELSSERRKTYTAVYHTDRKVMFQLADKEMPAVRTGQKGNNDLVLGTSDLNYRKLISWDQSYNDYYLVNVETGVKTLILEKQSSRVHISPLSKFIVWWSSADKAWMSLNTATGERKNISSGIKYPLYDEEWDSPDEPNPYGLEGWIEGEKYALLRDRYDIWLTDLNGSEPSVNLTRESGRKNKITFTVQNLDREKEYLARKETLWLSAFDNETKEAGYYTLKQISPAEPSKLYMGKVSFSRGITKAEKAGRLIWIRGNFEVCPELYTSNMDFSDARKISVTNPQQSQYNWGTVELVEWNSFDNTRLQGLLYKPEDFDPSRKYPMIVYFYEKSSDGLHAYWPPAPARSIINRVFAASNGYLVFVPDIPYKIGYPGKSCYDAVMSGTYAMLDKYPFIDRNRLGLDGQSWGGYQIAYLVTQTDLFACAYSGAPVVNMISAYGGIRWGSGMSRMFQYERTQSRIGGTLWEKPLHYIENSPIFWMPKVNTPLLIMHNDSDDAVPWYQGIEFITALRRLGKTAWMLTYNDDAHNLLKRPNMKDLAVRKMQFYDHYLKGSPMPYWMKNGISQLEKGKKDGYELVKD